MSADNPYDLPRRLERGGHTLIAESPVDYQNWLVEGWRDVGPVRTDPAVAPADTPLEVPVDTPEDKPAKTGRRTPA